MCGMATAKIQVPKSNVMTEKASQPVDQGELTFSPDKSLMDGHIRYSVDCY